MEKHQDVDEYLLALPPEAREILTQLRKHLLQLVPQAKEKMGYGIPTLTLNGNLIHFAAYKNHIGLYPGSKAIITFEKELSGYQTSKGTIQFPINEPLPMPLIDEIVAFCVEENLKKKK